MPLANAISAQLPALPFAVPLGTAAVLAAFNKFMPRRLADALAILATVITFSVSTLFFSTLFAPSLLSTGLADGRLAPAPQSASAS